MAKLKYDRPLNISFTKGTKVTVPKDEVWKITAEIDRGSNLKGISSNLYGGVQFLQWACWKCHRWKYTHRHRLQAHRRVSDAVEVMLHG